MDKVDMIKRWVIIVLAALLVVGVWGCGSESKYKKEIETIDRLIKTSEKMIKDLTRAKKPINFRRAIIDYIAAYKKMKPDLIALEKEFPHLLKSTGVNTAPDELKPHFRKAYGAIKRMNTVLEGKASRFGGDKTAMADVRKLKELMYYY
ncbi:MAG: hypothetical protein GY940_02880 [bacterium]|nr:hypothetical protein [bacterium]